MTNYVVATVKEWNIELYKSFVDRYPGQWHLLTSPEQLTPNLLSELKPRYIFFPHWNWIVPEEVLSNYECVCFHMTDVPYGRGGSPLQNLIIRGHKKTKLSALKMTSELDAGPVYSKKELSLDGSASEIYLRCSKLVFQTIQELVMNEPAPKEQNGEVVHFKRRTPSQSKLPVENTTLEAFYDYIRMLDANSYPHAFIEYGDLKIEFYNAEITDGQLKAKVNILFGDDCEK